MSFSYQSGANPPIDGPRFFASDTQQFKPDGVTRAYIFEDQEIQMVTNMVAPFAITGKGTFVGQASPRMVAAALIESLAGNKARLGGALQVLDIKLDLAAASKALLGVAKQMRDAENSDGSFAITEIGWNEPARRQRLWAMIERLAGTA